mgnify:CR=1 FL=1
MAYQVSMVLNLSRSAVCLLASAEPMVISTMALSITVLWTSAKKVRSKLFMAVLKLAKKYLTIGLWE